jgi:hypothetical protein
MNDKEKTKWDKIVNELTGTKDLESLQTKVDELIKNIGNWD